VSFDHPDIYADQDDYDRAFLQFARNVVRDGTLVLAADDPGCQRLRESLILHDDPGPQIVTFGESNDPDWRLISGDDGWIFVDGHGIRHQARLGVAGRHNARNAIAAIAALVALNIDPERALVALTPFTGVGRRFEHKGRIHHIDVIDDYAHHPEEISAVLAAARDLYPGRRIVAVHQPHTFTRTKTLLDGFVAALDEADHIVLLDLYPSGETETLGVSSRDILERLRKPAHAASGPEDAAAKTAALAQHGDVVLTLGAGDITLTGALLLERLKEQESASNDNADAVLPVKSAPRARKKPTLGFPIPGHPDLVVKPDADMSLYTTMRLGGNADYLVRATTAEAVVAAQEWALREHLPINVIGGGSNLLVGDNGIRGLVIVARTTGERATDQLTVEDRDDSVMLTVDAQAPLSWVGRYCAENGWAGMDWGVGLPGQIGGATVNNAGAHGTELKDNLIAIDILLNTGEIERVPATWLDPAYRMTKIKGAQRPRPWTVLRSVFELTKDAPGRLVALADEHADFRKRTQPTGACSGSTFANPEGDYAGRLLEEAGLKGYTIGAMQFSPKHANWVVNTGGGTARDAWALIQHARTVVKERYDIELHPEIERIGHHLD
jgi:UDP-N-acetylmuramate dehydrogenase